MIFRDGTPWAGIIAIVPDYTHPLARASSR
jgi:hypothetical protein